MLLVFLEKKKYIYSWQGDGVEMVEGLEAVGGEEIDKGKETGTDEEMDGTSKVVQEILADLKMH